jgi:hypothetical protein
MLAYVRRKDELAARAEKATSTADLCLVVCIRNLFDIVFLKFSRKFMTRVFSCGTNVSRVLSLAIPLAVENSIWYVSSIITTVFVGHLGNFELASVVLGTSIFNVTGYSILRGLQSGLETLLPQVTHRHDMACNHP